RQELDKVEIRATIDGVVTTPFVERMRNQHLDSGGEFLHLVETKRVRAELQVPEKELADVQKGFPVTLRANSYPTREFVGHVNFIAPVAQTVDANHLVVVRVELPNDDEALKPEMYGKAKIHCGDQRIIELMTRRMRRWINTDLWDILP